MQTTDKPEFVLLLGKLCAGFNAPLGDRVEAYWSGMSKMSLIEFSRCVDYALGEDGPERIPTTGQIWNIRKRLKSNASMHLPVIQPTTDRFAEGNRDNLVFFANRLFLRHVMSRGGLGPEMQPARRANNALVAEFAGFIREDDNLATRGEFVRRWLLAIDAVSPLVEKSKWEKIASDPRGNDLFRNWMADGITATGIGEWDRSVQA